MDSRKSLAASRRARAAIAVGALATMLIGSVAGVAQASTTWTVVKSPDVTLPGGTIQSVSCSAPDACTAVGTNLNSSGIDVTLAERWDGTAWQRQTTPNPPGNTSPSVAPVLAGVSCPRASFCAAVGAYQVQGASASIAETWNGSTWTSLPVPVPANSDGTGLTAVSCTSATFCEAVGSDFDINAGESVPFAITWNGSAWSLQTAPGPGGFNFEQFNTVSCTSAKFCEAWASGNAGNPGITVAEHWNGSSWQLQTVPSDATVNSVSCASATFCAAVGSGPAYRWNGAGWTAQTIPDPAGSAGLGGVSCASRAFCEAVGEYNPNGNVVGIAAAWNGSAWSSQSTPNPAGGTFTHLNAVSCASPASCVAGGYFEVQVTANDPEALTEAWTGTGWQLQHPVQPPAATYNTLASVSCASASFCEAVGTHFEKAGNQANLAEVWTGTSWSIQSIPDPKSTSGPIDNSLYSVSCVSATFCEAVGAGGDGAITETWNGTSWQLQTRPGAADVQPQAVSCAGASFCLAADGFGNVDLWNGSTWSAGPAVTGFSQVGSVSCLSASFCEAVGGGPAGQNAAVWDGTGWTDQSTPGGGALAAVSCTSPAACSAVGQNAQATLAESWNGSAWTVEPTPNPTATMGSVLSAVSCTSATFCVAAGNYQSSSVASFGALQTLVEVWDGTGWNLRTTPDPSTAQDLLSGVSCGSAQACTAVGQAQDPGGVQSTLIESGD
jgi:hypothetical protein